MNRIITPCEKAQNLECQIINLALYDKHSCSLLYDINKDDFIHPYNKSIKVLIDRMMEEKKSITPGSVYTEIVGTEFRDYFVSISQDQILSDLDTVYLQFNQYHRMVKMRPMLEELNQACIVGHPEFDNMFDNISDYFSSSKVAQDAIQMKDMMKRNPDEVKKNLVRHKTGIASLDEKIKYLYGGQYITIAGAPASGKSTIAMIIAENIPRSLIMSYEMSAEEIHDILISRKARVNSECIETGTTSFPEQQSIATARRILAEELSLQVCDSSLNMPDMFGFIKRAVRKHGIQCVVIDYAQIIPGLPGKGTQTEKYETLSRRFKNLARELKIVVIALSQLNKDSIREGRAPNLADLRGSLSFGSDSDKVIFMYDIPDDSVIGKGTPTCSLGKNRKGRIGKVDNFYYQKEIHYMR